MTESAHERERVSGSGLFSAVALLTRFPMSGRRLGEANTLFWFPTIGASVGLVVCGVGWAAARGLPELVAGAACTLALAWVTGSLHLDGVADTADGFSAAHSSPDRGLSAMRDSHIGAHGTVAVVLLLLSKFVLLTSLVAQPTLQIWLPACLCAGVCSRFWVAQRLTTEPAARSSGMAASVGQSSHAAAPWMGLALIVVLVTGASSLTFARSGEFSASNIALPCLVALAALSSSGAIVLVLARRARRAFGGLTGDVCGAGIELGEVCALLPWCVYANWLGERMYA